MGSNKSKQHFKFEDDHHQNWGWGGVGREMKATYKGTELRV